MAAGRHSHGTGHEVVGIVFDVELYDSSNTRIAAPFTRLNPLVWQRLYLSLLMFKTGGRVERAGSQTLLHMRVRFRSSGTPL
jgi:hypothetical protein